MVQTARRTARRFGLADALILLAATATGLAWGRIYLVAALQAREVPFGPLGIPPGPPSFASRLHSFTMGASRVLVCWSLAVVVVRLRPPRPRCARLLSQPGIVAVATATTYTIAIAADFFLAFLIRSKYKPTWSDYAGQAVAPYETARAIVAAWLILASSGRWRSEPNWIDRLGRLIGLAWLALSAAGSTFDWW